MESEEREEMERGAMKEGESDNWSETENGVTEKNAGETG